MLLAPGILGMGIGLGMGPGQNRARRPWYDPAALLDFDLDNNRVRYGGHSYSITSFLAAHEGSENSGTYVIGPAVVGGNIVENGSFDAGIEGWTGTVNDPELTWVDGKLRITATNATGQNRASTPVACTRGKAYRISIGPIVTSDGQSSLASFSNNAELSVSGTTISSGASAYGGAVADTMYVGGSTLAGSLGQWSEWDNFAVEEVVPLPGHDYEALSGVIVGSTPAEASGNKVLFQADDASVANTVVQERNRVRLVWDADKHLRLIVTFHNSEVANLDLGDVEVETPFTVRFSATTDEFKATLDGGPLVEDTAGSMPPIAVYRIGRSASGEPWGGPISRVQLYADTMSDAAMADPLKAFAIYGDSTGAGHGSGVTLTWFDALRASYTPARTVYNDSTGGQSITMLRDGLVADTEHRQWTTIIMDRPNTGETGEDWIAAVKAALANLETGRWLVVPPVINSPEAGGDNSATAIGYIQAALLSDPFFDGHTFDGEEQAAYADALSNDNMRTDGVHFNDDGQAAQALMIRSWLDARGW